MALTIDYRDYLRLLPRLKEAPQGNRLAGCRSDWFPRSFLPVVVPQNRHSPAVHAKIGASNTGSGCEP